MRVLVLGGGYAGLLVARKLERTLPDDAELVIVDETGDHLVQHELHRVVRKPDLADAISIPLSELTERASIVEARVREVDTEEKVVELVDGDRLSYDAAAVCLGAQTAYHGLPGVKVHSTPMKRLEHAAEARREFLDVAETGGTVVVGGAGLSGIQVAGEFAAFAREENVAEHVDVVVLEQMESVAPSFPENFQRAVRDELDRLDVTVEMGVTVAAATEDEIEFEGRDPLPYDQFVWTGGIRGADALSGERPQVRATLELADGTFAVGDAARIVDADGEAVPASAQAAVRASAVAARNIAKSLETDDDGFRPRLEQWRFDSPGWLVSVGDGAVAQLGPEVVTGQAAKLIKSSVGVAYLAEHGSLRDAVAVVREDLGETVPEFDRT